MKTQSTELMRHEELLRNVLQDPLTEEDALLWMVLLHTHRIHLHPKVVDRERPDKGEGRIVLPPETQRGAAEVIAALWPDRTDQRADSVYWYWQYNTKTPYEDLSQIPEHQRERLQELRNALAQDPRIAEIVEETGS